ncbi:MAG: twin-arginine translocase TatA/TatE family subunit [Parvularcula sp.]|jgi:sec-independent protein translocase protein TatA|nr:twin-arginine translocase TatA/TatE family subunit [Parvularcula sp.]
MVPGWQQLLIVLIIVLILFGGRGKISSLMGDLAKGVKSFRKGLQDDDDDTPSDAQMRSLGSDKPTVETGTVQPERETHKAQ